LHWMEIWTTILKIKRKFCLGSDPVQLPELAQTTPRSWRLPPLADVRCEMTPFRGEPEFVANIGTE
jgi:hypothetical protein